MAAQQQAEAMLTPEQLEAKRREDAARAFALAQAKAAADAAPKALEVQKAVYELAVQNPKVRVFVCVTYIRIREAPTMAWLMVVGGTSFKFRNFYSVGSVGRSLMDDD